MAVVIFGGLVSSTLLDTLLTPVLYLRYGREATERLVNETDTSRADAAVQESY